MKEKNCLQKTLTRCRQYKDDSSEDSISSTDCQENLSKFQTFSKKEKKAHLIELWYISYVKAKAGKNIIKFFFALQKRFYLFGVQKGVNKLKEINQAVPPYILMPESLLR